METTQLLNIFAPESTPASAIVELAMFVVGLTSVIFVVVASLLVYAVVRFRATAENSEREPAQVYGSTQIELAWTIVPVLIVLVLLAVPIAGSVFVIKQAANDLKKITDQAVGTNKGSSSRP